VALRSGGVHGEGCSAWPLIRRACGAICCCKPAKFICCAIYPLIFVVALNELSLRITLFCEGVDDGVRGVQLDGSVGDMRGEVGHAMVYDDVGIVWKVVHVVDMVYWEVLSSLMSA
jgi:hypothetical protein